MAKLRDRKPCLALVLQCTLQAAYLLVIVGATALAYWLIVSQKRYVNVVGKVPAGFNHFQFPAVFNNFYGGNGILFSKVLHTAIPITVLTYLESVSVGRKYALVHKYALDMTQELWALGIGCLVASFFQGYPVGGSFTRTSLKHEVGVRTPFANVFTALFVTFVLIVATDLLKYVPMAVLGAVMCTSIMSLFEFKEMWKALWVAPVDFLIMLFTFLVTLLWNVETGLQYGIISSVIILLLQISKLDMDSIGQLSYADPVSEDKKAWTPFKSLQVYPAARQHPSVKVFRLRANLFFGNVSAFRDEFMAMMLESGRSNLMKAVIIDASGIVEMDLAALAVIDELVTDLRQEEVEVFLASANPRIVKSLEAYDLLDSLGGVPLVQLDVEDVFWAVLEDLEMEASFNVSQRNKSRRSDASLALADFRAHSSSLSQQQQQSSSSSSPSQQKGSFCHRSASTDVVNRPQLQLQQQQKGGSSKGSSSGSKKAILPSVIGSKEREKGRGGGMGKEGVKQQQQQQHHHHHHHGYHAASYREKQEEEDLEWDLHGEEEGKAASFYPY